MNQRGEGEVGAIVGVIVLIAVGMWGYNHFLKPDEWSLMYENNLGVIVVAGDYSSRENCSIALGQAKQNPSKYYRPECGSNCKPPTTISGSYVCEKTFEI